MNTFIKEQREAKLYSETLTKERIAELATVRNPEAYEAALQTLGDFERQVIHATAKKIERRVEGKRAIDDGYNQAFTDVQSIIHDITDTKV